MPPPLTPPRAPPSPPPSAPSPTASCCVRPAPWSATNATCRAPSSTHLAEIDARRLYLQRGCSSLFDYAVRELGYSDAAAGRRIGAVRLCADQPGARERLRDGSLTLSAAAELQWAFDRQRRRGSISGTASSAPAESATETAPAPAAAPSASEPPLVLDAAGRQKLLEDGGRQERPAGPPDAGRPGPGAGGAGRPDAPAR